MRLRRRWCRSCAYAIALASIAASPASAWAQTTERPLPRCAPLPEAPPMALIVEHVQRGASPGMRHRTIVTRGTPCPETSAHVSRLERTSGSTRACVAIDDVAAQQLWARLRALHVERI
ncbi:MAG: hypothetical protein M3Y87_17335, partial [Myxococcota bacterium]|nr:hypothetical protein [Myxococcota bacterium]